MQSPGDIDTIRHMTKQRTASRGANLKAMVVLGAGLILVGLAALIAWPTSEAGTPSTGEFKTVPVAVDYAAPKLSLSDLNGMEYSLADYHGKVVLVNLWATWCPPCKAEMPILKAYYEDHAADGFVTIAVNDGDPADAVAAFVEKHELTFPVWLDPTYEATERAFKARNLPSTFVIDREGTIRLRWVGEIDRAGLEKYVTPLILE